MTALIVGGGPAGAAAALALAQAGADHLLIERTAAPTDSLCGGFLSWRTLAQLERFGIEGATLNPTTITALRLTWRGRVADAPLPRPARCVSRARLDPLLLGRAERAGARIARGTAARAWEGGAIRTDDGATLTAGTLFLATGKHDLRGLARPEAARGADPALGLRVRLGPHPALDRMVANRIELHLFDRGYAGVAAQEDGTVNLCMAVRRSRLGDAGSPRALLDALAAESPHLGNLLAHLSAEPRIDAVANVPYGWRARDAAPGIFRLGDQAAVIPSLAGEGMGIAIASGFAAAADLIAGRTDYQRRFARRTARAVAVAGAVRAAAEHPRSAPLLLGATRLVPGAANLVAHLTRIW
jgi:flavin-dependent dehydrogenase